MPLPSSVRSRIGTRISSRNRCGPDISTPGVRELERGLEQRSPREPPVARVRLRQPGDEPGNGDRSGADVKDLRRRVAEVDHHLVHRLLRP